MKETTPAAMPPCFDRLSQLEGTRTIAIVMNASTFNQASEIDYFITNVESTKATAEWIVTTYAQRNWVEVFYREALMMARAI
jgi:hypothetical protein